MNPNGRGIEARIACCLLLPGGQSRDTVSAVTHLMRIRWLRDDDYACKIMRALVEVVHCDGRYLRPIFGVPSFFHVWAACGVFGCSGAAVADTNATSNLHQHKYHCPCQYQYHRECWWRASIAATEWQGLHIVDVMSTLKWLVAHLS